MRFSHAADCHVGAHRDPRLRALSEAAFARFVDGSIADHVDFCLIAGDLFNTAIPGIDALKFAVTQLSRLKERGIPVYAIPGSHDFSPSGKTMLDVLERAGLLVNVFKGEVVDGKLRLALTDDPKTGARIAGIPGRRGMLDRKLYEDLDREALEQEDGERIFLFHTAIAELMPHGIPLASQPLSFLPRGFSYYAGGHVHIVERYARDGYRDVVYPGPLFPNSFSELEELGQGGYWLYDAGRLERRPIALKKVVGIRVSVDGASGDEAKERLRKEAGRDDVRDAIVLVRVEGTLSDGTSADLDLQGLAASLEQRGAYAVLRNTARLLSAQLAQPPPSDGDAQDIEEEMLERWREQLALPHGDGPQLARELLRMLAREQKEGEKAYEYQEHVVKDALELAQRRLEGKMPAQPREKPQE